LKGELPNNISEEISKDNDLIVILDILEQIDDDAGSSAALSNYVKNEGRLIITVPAFLFLWIHHDEQHHHKRRYTVKRLKQLVENNGWQVNYISYFNSFLFPLALADRLKRKIVPSVQNSDLKMLPEFINSLFEKAFSFESILIGNFVFPFGLLIMLVAKKI